MKSQITNRKSKKSRDAKERQPRPFLLALMLTGILAFEVYPNLTNNAIADADVINLAIPTETKGKLTANKFDAIAFQQADNNKFKNSVFSVYTDEKELTNDLLLISENWLEEELSNLIKLNTDSPKANSRSLAQNTEELPQLPKEIINAVRQDLEEKIGISPTEVRVTEAERQTWPNSCLGLAKSDELCAQVLVQGWRVVLSNGRETWVYRSDDRARQLRMEPMEASTETGPGTL